MAPVSASPRGLPSMLPQELFSDSGAGVLGSIGIISFNSPDEPLSDCVELALTLRVVYNLTSLFFLGLPVSVQPFTHDLFQELGNRFVPGVCRLFQLDFELGRTLLCRERRLLHARHGTASTSRTQEKRSSLTPG